MGNSQATWDQFWASDEEHAWWKKPAPEVLEFIGSQSPQSRPDVLDLGCGLGRHAIAFAQAGFRVTATDASEAAIQHLQEWAGRLNVQISTRRCDVLDESFLPDTFDIVLSYNVIYHGRREDFGRAICHVRGMLRVGGLFFFTCPTREDGKYGHGPQIAPHTFACDKSITPGDIHYFADESDLDELLAGFAVLSRRKDQGHWDNRGTPQFYSTWQVLASKTAPASPCHRVAGSC